MGTFLGGTPCKRRAIHKTHVFIDTPLNFVEKRFSMAKDKALKKKLLTYSRAPTAS